MGNSFKILKLNQISSRTQINCKASNNEILKYLTPRFIPHIVGFEHNQNQAKWGIGSPRTFCASPFCRSFNHFPKLYKILIDNQLQTGESKTQKKTGIPHIIGLLCTSPFYLIILHCLAIKWAKRGED